MDLSGDTRFWRIAAADVVHDRGADRRDLGGTARERVVILPGQRLPIVIATSVADLRKSNADLVVLNARFEHLAKELRRARFRPRSEKLSPHRLELAFEDIETAMAEARAAGHLTR